MLELLGSGVLGSLVGGIFRLAPEILKFLDSKNERSHELRMFQEQVGLEKVKGEFKMEDKYVDHSVAQLSAITEAFKSQAAEAAVSYKWVSALSALVRPSVTYILFTFYIVFKIIMVTIAWEAAVSWEQIAKTMWTADDFGMLNMILTFWFVGRAIEKYKDKEK
jgi:hypothetical protein